VVKERYSSAMNTFEIILVIEVGLIALAQLLPWARRP
jgi:hypothetical protein